MKEMYKAEGADILLTESIDGTIVVATAINPFQAKMLVGQLNLCGMLLQDMATEDAFNDREAARLVMADDSFNEGENSGRTASGNS